METVKNRKKRKWFWHGCTMYLVIDGLWEDFSRHIKAERIPTHSGGLSGSRIFLKIISVTKSSSLVLISHATLPFNVIAWVSRSMKFSSRRTFLLCKKSGNKDSWSLETAVSIAETRCFSAKILYISIYWGCKFKYRWQFDAVKTFMTLSNSTWSKQNSIFVNLNSL